MIVTRISLTSTVTSRACKYPRLGATRGNRHAHSHLAGGRSAAFGPCSSHGKREVPCSQQTTTSFPRFMHMKTSVGPDHHREKTVSEELSPRELYDRIMASAAPLKEASHLSYYESLVCLQHAVNVLPRHHQPSQQQQQQPSQQQQHTILTTATATHVDPLHSDRLGPREIVSTVCRSWPHGGVGPNMLQSHSMIDATRRLVRALGGIGDDDDAYDDHGIRIHDPTDPSGGKSPSTKGLPALTYNDGLLLWKTLEHSVEFWGALECVAWLSLTQSWRLSLRRDNAMKAKHVLAVLSSVSAVGRRLASQLANDAADTHPLTFNQLVLALNALSSPLSQISQEVGAGDWFQIASTKPKHHKGVAIAKDTRSRRKASEISEVCEVVASAMASHVEESGGLEGSDGRVEALSFGALRQLACLSASFATMHDGASTLVTLCQAIGRVTGDGDGDVDGCITLSHFTALVHRLLQLGYSESDVGELTKTLVMPRHWAKSRVDDMLAFAKIYPNKLAPPPSAWETGGDDGDEEAELDSLETFAKFAFGCRSLPTQWQQALISNTSTRTLKLVDQCVSSDLNDGASESEQLVVGLKGIALALNLCRCSSATSLLEELKSIMAEHGIPFTEDVTGLSLFDGQRVSGPGVGDGRLSPLPTSTSTSEPTPSISSTRPRPAASDLKRKQDRFVAELGRAFTNQNHDKAATTTTATTTATTATAAAAAAAAAAVNQGPDWRSRYQEGPMSRIGDPTLPSTQSSAKKPFDVGQRDELIRLMKQFTQQPHRRSRPQGEGQWDQRLNLNDLRLDLRAQLIDKVMTTDVLSHLNADQLVRLIYCLALRPSAPVAADVDVWVAVLQRLHLALAQSRFSLPELSTMLRSLAVIYSSSSLNNSSGTNSADEPSSWLLSSIAHQLKQRLYEPVQDDECSDWLRHHCAHVFHSLASLRYWDMDLAGYAVKLVFAFTKEEEVQAPHGGSDKAVEGFVAQGTKYSRSSRSTPPCVLSRCVAYLLQTSRVHPGTPTAVAHIIEHLHTIQSVGGMVSILASIGRSACPELSSHLLIEVEKDLPHRVGWDGMKAAMSINPSIASNLKHYSIALEIYQQRKPAWTSAFQDEVDRLGSTLVQGIPSWSHLQVGNLVSELGHSLVNEYPVAGSGYVVDIAIPRHKVAIEYDGPSHFTSNNHEVLTRTLFKRRVLKECGWHVIPINHRMWGPLDTLGQAQWLQEQLKLCGITV